jgi:hypothetical protein
MIQYCASSDEVGNILWVVLLIILIFLSSRLLTKERELDSGHLLKHEYKALFSIVSSPLINKLYVAVAQWH